MRRISTLVKLSLAMATALALSTAASATIIPLSVSMDGSKANAGAGTGSLATGSATLTLDTDTNALTWDITWADLGSAATAMHFHGPALPNQSTGVVVDVGVAGTPLHADLFTPSRPSTMTGAKSRGCGSAMNEFGRSDQSATTRKETVQST